MDRTQNEDSAARRQGDSDYSGISDADLTVIHRALGKVPGTLAVGAVYGRVGREIDRRTTTAADRDGLRAAQADEDNRVRAAWEVDA